MRVFKASLTVFVLALIAALFVAAAYGAIFGDVFGLFSFEVVINFFEGYTAEQLLIGFFVALLTLYPDLGVRFLNWLKNRWGFEDDEAHDFIFVVCYLLAGIALLVTGALDLSGFQFKLGNLIGVGSTIYALSQIGYRKFFKPRE